MTNTEPASGAVHGDDSRQRPRAGIAEKHGTSSGADGTRSRFEDVAKRHEETHDPSGKQGDQTIDDVASRSTFRHASQRGQPEPADEDLEAAIVRAALDGRDADREIFASILRARRHERAGAIVLPPKVTAVQ